MEGGIHPSDTTACRDYFSLAWKNPYVLRLAFSAGIGGLLFGYDTDLLVAFNYDERVSFRYKYKFLRATTSNIPSSVIKDNRGTKLTIGRGDMLKVQHLVSVARSSLAHPHIDSAIYQQPSRIAYIEFFVKPEVDEGNTDD